jgi:hypothetical protein
VPSLPPTPGDERSAILASRRADVCRPADTAEHLRVVRNSRRTLRLARPPPGLSATTSTADCPPLHNRPLRGEAMAHRSSMTFNAYGEDVFVMRWRPAGSCCAPFLCRWPDRRGSRYGPSLCWLRLHSAQAPGPGPSPVTGGPGALRIAGAASRTIQRGMHIRDCRLHR